MNEKKYIKDGDKIYLIKEETTKDILLDKINKSLSNLETWKVEALERIESDFVLQKNQLLIEKKEIEKL